MLRMNNLKAIKMPSKIDAVVVVVVFSATSLFSTVAALNGVPYTVVLTAAPPVHFSSPVPTSSIWITSSVAVVTIVVGIVAVVVASVTAILVVVVVVVAVVTEVVAAVMVATTVGLVTAELIIGVVCAAVVVGCALQGSGHINRLDDDLVRPQLQQRGESSHQ